MDEERLKKTCIKKKEKRASIHQSFYSTWVLKTGRMLRQDTGMFLLGKCLNDKQIPRRQRKRCETALAEITPTASQLTKSGKI